MYYYQQPTNLSCNLNADIYWRRFLLWTRTSAMQLEQDIMHRFVSYSLQSLDFRNNHTLLACFPCDNNWVCFLFFCDFEQPVKRLTDCIFHCSNQKVCVESMAVFGYVNKRAQFCGTHHLPDMIHLLEAYICTYGSSYTHTHMPT
jgi:hypothetical protein